MNTTQQQQDLVTLFDEHNQPVLFVAMSDFIDDETAADLARYGISI